MVNELLESRSTPPLPTITLTDTLIYDPNGNMTANPGDSIKYTIILRNETGQSVLNAIINHSGDPIVSFDPNSLKASPLAFNDTIQFITNPMLMAAPGVLSNDFDLNDPLPNPPFYFDLMVHRVESNQANVGNSISSAAGGWVTLNMNGSLTYDTTGIHGAIVDSIHYTIKDADGFEDSAVILFHLPPVISSNLTATDTICAFEQQDTFLMTPAFEIRDDKLNSEGATVAICNNYLASEDTLITGTLPGGITSIWTEGIGTLALSGTASLADYEAAIESIQYTNQNNSPSAAVRSICITVFDGSLYSNQVTRLLKIKPVNYCPILQRDTISIFENGPIPGFSVLTNDTDPDLNILSVTKINNDMSLSNVMIQGGTVSLHAITGNIDFVHTSGLDSLSSGEVYITRFSYTACDGHCEVSDSVIIKITGVDDSPVLSGTSMISYIENGMPIHINSSILLLDIDNMTEAYARVGITNYVMGEDVLSFTPTVNTGTIAGGFNASTGVYTLLSGDGTGSLAQFQAALREITYINTSDNPNSTTRDLNFVVFSANGFSSNQVNSTISIAPINDAPVLSGGSIVNYTEEGPPVVLNPYITVNDVDNQYLSSATVTITNYKPNEDVLSFTSTGNTGAILGLFDSGTGVLILLAPAFGGTPTEFQAALREIKYSNSTVVPTAGIREVSFILNDGETGNNLSNTVYSTINVFPGLELPSLSGTTTSTYIENQAPVIVNNLITISGFSGNLLQATIRIINFSPGDELTFVSIPGTGDILSATSVNGILFLVSNTGFESVEHFQAALREIKYSNTTDDPDTSTRIVSFIVYGTFSSSNELHCFINVIPVNDPPFLMGSSKVNYTENGPPVMVNPDIIVFDLDNTTMFSATVTISPFSPEDQLFFTPNGNTGILEFSYSGGFPGNTWTLTGPAIVSQFQAALREIKYSHNGDNPSTAIRIVSFRINDGESTDNLSFPLESTVNIIADDD